MATVICCRAAGRQISAAGFDGTARQSAVAIEYTTDPSLPRRAHRLYTYVDWGGWAGGGGAAAGPQAGGMYSGAARDCDTRPTLLHASSETGTGVSQRSDNPGWIVALYVDMCRNAPCNANTRDRRASTF